MQQTKPARKLVTKEEVLRIGFCAPAIEGKRTNSTLSLVGFPSLRALRLSGENILASSAV